MSLKMLIFNFNDCLTLLKIHLSLDNETDIFIGIMEYNTQINKEGKYDINSSPVNSTTYQFFINNGTILDHSICFYKNFNITVQKMVDMDKLNIYKDEIKEINDNYNLSSLFNNGTEFNDNCIPLSLNGKDLTIYDRQFLVSKIIKPCDNNCKYIDFNFTSNYSTCICPIDLPNNKKYIDNQIKDAVKETDIGKNLDILFEHANFKYIRCSNNLWKINYSYFFFVILFIVFIAFVVILSIKYCKCLNKPKNDNEEENQKNEIVSSDEKQVINNEIIIYKDDKKPKNDNEEENQKNEIVSSDEKQDINNVIIHNDKNTENCNKNNKSFDIHQNLKEKLLHGIFKEQYVLFIILLFITYFFFNVFLFTDEYISVRYSYKADISFPYIIFDEINRISVVTFCCFFVLKCIKWIFDKKTDDKKLFKGIKIILIIFTIFMQIFFFYFIHIFININPNSIKPLISSTILSLIFHIIIDILLILIQLLLIKIGINDFFISE